MMKKNNVKKKMMMMRKSITIDALKVVALNVVARHVAMLSMVTLSALLFGIPALAPVHAQDGDDKPPPVGRVLKDQSGDDFMEEITPAQPAPPIQHHKQMPIVDLSTVGIPTDPQGHIIPIIDNQGGPVRQNYSQTQMYTEPGWNFLPAPIYSGYYSPYARPVYPAYPYPYQPSYNLRIGRNFGMSVTPNPGPPLLAPGPMLGPGPLIAPGSLLAPGYGYSPNSTGMFSGSGLGGSGLLGGAPGLLGGTTSFSSSASLSGDTPTFSSSGTTRGFGLFAPTTQWQSTTMFKQMDLNSQSF